MSGTQNWQVVGRIAGARLPDRVVSLGRISLGPHPHAAKMMERQNAKATPSAGTHFVGTSADLRVSSDCQFWVEHQSGRAIDATEAVSEDDALLLQVAMSLRTDSNPYQVEVVCAFGSTTVESAFGAGIGTAFWHPEKLTDDLVQQATADLHFLETNEKARMAARTLGETIRLTTFPLRRAELGTALLGYFKVIEAIANSVELETPAGLERKQQHFLNQLLDDLKSKKILRKKVTAVRDTAKQLARLESLFLGLRVDAVAERLGMSTKWRTRAQEFVTLRNVQLGHAGRELSQDQLGTWLDFKASDSAYSLARDLLAAYADHKGKV